MTFKLFILIMSLTGEHIELPYQLYPTMAECESIGRLKSDNIEKAIGNKSTDVDFYCQESK